MTVDTAGLKKKFSTDRSGVIVCLRTDNLKKISV